PRRGCTRPRSPTSRPRPTSASARSICISRPRNRCTTRWSKTRWAGSRSQWTRRAREWTTPPSRAARPRGPSAALRRTTARCSSSSSARPPRATTSCGARRRSSRTTSNRPFATASRVASSAPCRRRSPPHGWSGCPRSCSRGGRSTRPCRSSGSRRPSSRSPCGASARADLKEDRFMYAPPAGDALTPDERERQIELLSTTFNTAYAWNYEMVRRELHNLYEKAKRDQWNATEQLPWQLGVDVEAENLPDMQIPIYGTHLWDRLTPAEVRKLRREQLRWLLSNFMHGEQGALLAAAQIVDATPWMEAKFYGSTQVMDEARHVEVFSRYLNEKLGGPYRINPNLKGLLDQILTDSRWDMKYLGMQITVEGLQRAAFGFMHKTCSEPLLTDLLHYVIRDESRHVAFGVIALNDYFRDMPPHELREREEFVYEGCRLMRDRLLADEVWETMGLPVEETKPMLLT